MSSRGRAFNEVKDLLGKLDRGIDEARKKRLHGDEPEDAETAETKTEADAKADQPGGNTTTAPRPGASPYGRARPLRRPGDENGSAWRTP